LKAGKLGGKKAGRLEGWKAWRQEGWKAGRLGGLKAGKLGGFFLASRHPSLQASWLFQLTTEEFILGEKQ